MTITVTISGGEDNMYMPFVEGWDARKAVQLLQNEMGLDVKQEEDWSDAITKGFVISQSLVQDIKVVKGQEVTIVVSKGPEQKQATVTRFLNVPIEDAKVQIEQLGLKVGEVREQFSDEYAEGRVSWQSIEPSTQVDKGTSIDLWVSKGPEPVATPTPEPTPTPPPPSEPSDMPPAQTNQPPEPTMNVSAAGSSQTVTADLSGYSGSVHVTITVGDKTIFDNKVDADLNNSVPRTVYGTGEQMVFIYINGVLVSSYLLRF